MNIIYLDIAESTIEMKSGVLRIGDRKIPLALVDTIVIGGSATFSSNTILALTSEGISIVLARSDRYAIIHGAKTKNSELKAAQYEALNDSLFIAKYLVTEKIIRHANSLKTLGVELEAEPALKQADFAKTIEELRGIEGAFAHRYFNVFFSLIDHSLHNGTRVKRPPTDPANALLSYLYSLFYHMLSVRLLANGFELGIAYLHVPFRSHNALASDLIELFRHSINESVIKLFANGILDHSDFAKKDGVYIRSEARRKLYVFIKDFWLLHESSISNEIANLRRLICRRNSDLSS